MNALQRLKNAVSMKATRRTISMPNGEEFEYWAPPITLAQRAKAQKAAGSDDATAFALQLLVMIATDENGQPMFSAGQIAEMRNELPASLIEGLLLQLLNEEPEEALDMKSTEAVAQEGRPLVGAVASSAGATPNAA